jgi:hypothetical protein
MAFEILARLGLNATGFQSGMKRAESAGTQFARNLRNQVAGAFGVAAVTQFTRSVFNAADAIGDLRDQTNLTTKDIQEFQAIAGKSGLEITTLTQFIEKLREARREAQQGKEEFRSVFNQMGIDPTRLDALSDPGDLLRSFAAEFAKFDEQSRNAIATTIGGTRAGGRLSSTLVDIGRGAKSGEIQFSDSDVRTAAQVDNFVASMGRQVKVGYAKFLQSDFGGLLGLFYRKAAEKSKQEERQAIIEAKAAEPTLKAFVPPIPAAKAEKEEAARDAAALVFDTFRPELSSLQRIGAQIDSAPLDIQRRQLEKLDKIEQHTRKTATNATSDPLD